MTEQLVEQVNTSINVNIHYTSIFRKRLIFPRWGWKPHLSHIYIYYCMLTSRELNVTKRCLCLYILIPLGPLWWCTCNLYAYSSCWAIREEIVPGGLSGWALTWTVWGMGLIPTWGKSILSLKMDVWWVFTFITACLHLENWMLPKDEQSCPLVVAFGMIRIQICLLWHQWELKFREC